MPQRHDALRTADRHSARVRFLRRAIVIGASVTTAFIAVIGLFDPFKHMPVTISVASVHLNGTRVTTEDPKMTGFRKDGRAYEIVASSGIQDILDTNITELVGVKAKVVMGDDSTARVLAGFGTHDSLHDTMKLRENVHILNAAGYEFLMKSVTMNFKSNDMVTDEPATLLLNGARFDADRMTIGDNGHRVTFEGSVKSVIQQDSTDTSVGALTSAER
ncbi:LPS export ABC transporter periplasmic protein LptC [Methyloferula stellata]|uniref:LPS export ABC transporter periplasmic protein LptC n=1 Tax=Methyloferula stellata TaxID=876270 RepID=UPI00039E4C1E|nr:LPS export ABC transporter periplasmic protein LptC [Methyloferula stellata]